MTPTGHRLQAAVICVPGLEAVTASEMAAWGCSPPKPAPAGHEPGVLEISADHTDLYRLNLHLQTASRILVRLGSFPAAAFSELRKKAARLPWASYVLPGQPVGIRVATFGSRLYHKKGIAERVAGAVGDALGQETPLIAVHDEDGDAQAPLLVVRLSKNMCSVSIDSSGAHLHRRGYRLASGKAPLRETLAAALVRWSGWPMDVPLVDPFCGSGTILIEAARMAAGLPPGLNRSFAFENWPTFQSAVWTRIRADAAPTPRSKVPVMAGSDRDAGVIRMAQANAERAGVGDMIQWSRQSISDLVLPEIPGWIITNPPYGERVKGGPDLRNLYARMGTVWRERAGLWRIYLVSGSRKWSGHMGLPTEQIAHFQNGGIPVDYVQIKESTNL